MKTQLLLGCASAVFCASLHGATIARWELNETNGNVLSDAVGGHDHTTRPSLNFNGPDLAGDGGTSISFANATGTAPASPTVNGGDMFVSSNTQFTAEGFFRITTPQVNNSLNYIMGTRDGGVGWAIWVRPTGLLGFLFQGSGGLTGTDFVGTNLVVADGATHHFALVLDKTNGTTAGTGKAILYIDGTTNHVMDNIPANRLDQDNLFRIGWRAVANTTQFRGHLDKLRFSNTTLTPAEFLSADTDRDGMPDTYEDRFAFLDRNNPADAALDQDSDGLANVDEYRQGTDPTRADTDNDGLTDGTEVNTHRTNPLVADTDGDGLSDSAEINTHHTNPNAADTDRDGLADGAEVNTHNTNPNDKDTDRDGFSDAVEVAAGSNPNESGSTPSVSGSIIALWEMDEFDGALLDSVGGGAGPHHVTVDPLVGYGKPGLVSDGGTSINFSRANITPVGTNASDLFVRSNLQFTAEGFFQISATNASTNLNFIMGSRRGLGWAIWVRDNQNPDTDGHGGYLGFIFQGSGGNTGTDFQGRTRVDDGQVHHFALVFDKYNGTTNGTGKATLYLDGRVDFVMDNIPANRMDADDGFMIGRRDSAPFKGNLDKLRFSRLALAPQDRLFFAPSFTGSSYDKLNQAMTLRLTGMPGTTYRIQFTESLPAPSWTNLETVLAPPNGMFSVTDTNAATASRFYRAVSP